MIKVDVNYLRGEYDALTIRLGQIDGIIKSSKFKKLSDNVQSLIMSRRKTIDDEIILIKVMIKTIKREQAIYEFNYGALKSKIVRFTRTNMSVMSDLDSFTDDELIDLFIES